MPPTPWAPLPGPAAGWRSSGTAALVTSDTPARASCVSPQGFTAEEAMTMLREALTLFLEGCREERLMDRVLKESGLEVLNRAGDPAQ